MDISEEDIYFCLQKQTTHVFFCIDDEVES